MKSQIEQPFGYTGNVTISAVRGKTTFYKYSFHNAGTKLLFQGLCNLLAGESYASQKGRIPHFIRLYNKDGETVQRPTALTYAAIRYNTSLQVKAVDDNTNFVTVFHFAIPSTQINKTTNLMINHLRLFGETEDGGAMADTDDYVLATFDIPEGKGITTQSLTTNTQYIVEWSLGFSNKDGSSSVLPSNTQSTVPATNTSTPEADNTSSTEEADPSESTEPEDPTENEEP